MHVLWCMVGYVFGWCLVSLYSGYVCGWMCVAGCVWLWSLKNHVP